MKRIDVRLVVGVFLVLVGVLAFLQTMGVVGNAMGLFWALVFAAAGAVFVYVFFTDRAQWWPIIPGFTLLGLGLLIALSLLFPYWGGEVGGAIFLASIGLAFLAIYYLRRDFWWAVIPGGVLVTLAVVAGISPVMDGTAVGGVFFVGLALTFGSLYFLPAAQGQQKWAIIPAIVLLALGALLLVEAVSNLSYALPVVLILAGGYLLWRAFGSRHA